MFMQKRKKLKKRRKKAGAQLILSWIGEVPGGKIPKKNLLLCIQLENLNANGYYVIGV